MAGHGKGGRRGRTLHRGGGCGKPAVPKNGAPRPFFARQTRMNHPARGIAASLARSLDRATGEGYRLGYEIARDEAAFIALEAGRPDLAERIRALRPLPVRQGPQG